MALYGAHATGGAGHQADLGAHEALTRGYLLTPAAAMRVENDRRPPVLRKRIVEGDGLPPVWPDPEGPVRGESFTPLYPSQAVIRAVVAAPPLYEAVALVDAIRDGSARERHVATELLEQVVARRER